MQDSAGHGLDIGGRSTVAARYLRAVAGDSVESSRRELDAVDPALDRRNGEVPAARIARDSWVPPRIDREGKRLSDRGWPAVSAAFERLEPRLARPAAEYLASIEELRTALKLVLRAVYRAAAPR